MKNTVTKILKEILSNLNRRFVIPFYIPVIALMCSMLLIKSNRVFLNKFCVFTYSFIILIFTELTVRYTGINNVALYTFVLLPFLLFFICYLILFLNFMNETKKYE